MGLVNAGDRTRPGTSTSAYGFEFRRRAADRHPRVRSFGLAHVDADRVIHAFPDLAGGTAECPADAPTTNLTAV